MECDSCHCLDDVPMRIGMHSLVSLWLFPCEADVQSLVQRVDIMRTT
ncbi:hypothetical protein [Chitinivibrio alkaliphilus]|uniref:Uncharacterized protein n=1 Tax=Chitinivibrio alkaliphilus ACht1 TaxID=1313304 RepID=U7D8B9_9BACT|nr:hypothetical protein [Chitinivibrio alkaliphilus]ERP31816.1 hypothetical protein CALK_1263 [Chitinivibrio alkaliphilus ACht1]